MQNASNRMPKRHFWMITDSIMLQGTQCPRAKTRTEVLGAKSEMWTPQKAAGVPLQGVVRACRLGWQACSFTTEMSIGIKSKPLASCFCPTSLPSARAHTNNSACKSEQNQIPAPILFCSHMAITCIHLAFCGCLVLSMVKLTRPKIHRSHKLKHQVYCLVRNNISVRQVLDAVAEDIQAKWQQDTVFSNYR